MESKKVVVAGPVAPSTINSPLDFRTRVNTVDEIYNIDLPFVGMIVYVINEDKYYKIKTLKSKEIGLRVIENAAVDTFEEFLIEGPQGEQGPPGKDFDESMLNKKLNIIDSKGKGFIAFNADNKYKAADGYHSSADSPGQYSSTFGYNCIGYGQYSHAEGYYTDAIGEASHAEGYQTWALKRYSHAEGAYTNALGECSHAEGGYTDATGKYSHSEGWSTESAGECSHSEGHYTDAAGTCSHAEGYSANAHGDYSHAEGYYTNAAGKYSHSEGCYTKANECQHVQGKYNINDTKCIYAHIVGNGNSSTRSNAHTLDWNGNAWFQGDVFIKGTSQDDAQKLATEDMVIALQQEIEQLRIMIEELRNNQ